MPNTGTFDSTSVVDRISERRGIAGSVAEEDAVRFRREQFGCWRRGRIDAHIAAVRAQPAQDVPFHSEIVGGDLQPSLRAARRCHAELVGIFLRPVERLRRRHDADQIGTFHRRNRPRAIHEGVGIQSLAGPDHAAQHAARSEMARERPGIDVGNRDDLVVDEIVAQRAIRAPVAGDRRLVADDESRHLRRARFDVFRRHAVVPDLGTRHRHDLAGIRRVGEHFLVAGHGRVEYDLTARLALGAGGDAAIPGSVFEC
jgi:hypothetical protein